MRKLFALLVVLTCIGGTAVYASVLEKGNSELSVAFDYSNVKPDEGDSVTNWHLNGGYGYMLTKGNEVGLQLDYTKSDNDLFSVDGMGIGLFYNYNFAAGDMFNPYLGANYIFYTGDIGDLFDSSYGVQGGVKIWPWENAGFNTGLHYQWNTGAGDNLDATEIRIFLGLLLKF